MKIHNQSRTRLYNIWVNMKQRCGNSKNTHFKYYGGKGIVVCNMWRNDFMSFYKWSHNNGYSDNLTIDRIDAGKNYTPLNCRWITRKEQLIGHGHKNKYRGVSKARGGRFRSTITVDGKQVHIGQYKTEIEASEAFNSYCLDNNIRRTR